MKVLFSHKKKRYEEEDCIPVEQEQEQEEAI